LAMSVDSIHLQTRQRLENVIVFGHDRWQYTSTNTTSPLRHQYCWSYRL